MTQLDLDVSTPDLRELAPRHCLLCGAVAAWVAQWDVDDEMGRQLGGAPGVPQTVIYAVCGACHDRPDVTRRCHAKIRGEHHAEAGDPRAN